MIHNNNTVLIINVIIVPIIVIIVVFITISAFSQDDIHIIFKHEAIFEAGDHFFEELEFVVELLHFGNAYLFLGNITRPSSNFSSIRLQPEGSTCTMPFSAGSPLSFLPVEDAFCISEGDYLE